MLFILHFLLEPLEQFGEGNYALSDVKEVFVTEDFLGMDDEIKLCQNEGTTEDCWMKNYLRKGFSKCKCLPYELRNYSIAEVTKRSFTDVMRM